MLKLIQPNSTMINSLEICHIQPWSFFFSKDVFLLELIISIMVSYWVSSTVSSCHPMVFFSNLTFPRSLDHRVWHLRLDHPNVVKFFESSRRPNGWGGWRQRAKAPETLGLEYGVSELFFFFWPPWCYVDFQGKYKLFQPHSYRNSGHLGSMGSTKSRSNSCICSFFWWGGGLVFSMISTFSLVLTRGFMDG